MDYIANSGYIENTDKAKQLFTFRLTGRCKPVSLEKIIWDGRENNSPNELIYIIRFATDNSKSKYKKMMKFFEGPEIPSKNRCGYADQARIEFRVKLNSLYPDIF